MAIVVRYGDDGGLLQLAHAAGQAMGNRRAYDQQLAYDQRFLNAERDRQVQMRGQSLAAQLEAVKAQQAQRLSVPPPPSGPSLIQQAGLGRRQGALLQLAGEYGDRGTVGRILGAAQGLPADPMAQAKAAYLDSIAKATGLPQAERDALAALAASPDVDLRQLQTAAQAASVRARQSAPDPDAAAKRTFVENVAMGLPEEERAALAAMASSADTSLSQLRVAADAARARAQQAAGVLTPQQITQMQFRSLESELPRVQRQAQMLAANFSPAEQAMSVEEFAAAEQQRLADIDLAPWWPGHRGAPWPSARRRVEEEETASANRILLFQQFKAAQQRAQEIEAGRRSILQGGGVSRGVPQQSAPVDVSSMSNEDLISALLGGG